MEIRWLRYLRIVLIEYLDDASVMLLGGGTGVHSIPTTWLQILLPTV
ncbi:MAG: hypothetical protein IJA85_03685 [Clostridia bacterium]|nr:hypothetical protein [Clostridia bacterium]